MSVISFVHVLPISLHSLFSFKQFLAISYFIFAQFLFSLNSSLHLSLPLSHFISFCILLSIPLYRSLSLSPIPPLSLFLSSSLSICSQSPSMSHCVFISWSPFISPSHFIFPLLPVSLFPFKSLDLF